MKFQTIACTIVLAVLALAAAPTIAVAGDVRSTAPATPSPQPVRPSAPGPVRGKPDICQAQRFDVPEELFKTDGEKRVGAITTPRGRADVMAVVKSDDITDLYPVVQGKRLALKSKEMPQEVAACAKSKGVTSSERRGLLRWALDLAVPDAEARARCRVWMATVCYDGEWCSTCMGCGNRTYGCYDW